MMPLSSAPHRMRRCVGILAKRFEDPIADACHPVIETEQALSNQELGMAMVSEAGEQPADCK